MNLKTMTARASRFLPSFLRDAMPATVFLDPTTRDIPIVTQRDVDWFAAHLPQTRDKTAETMKQQARVAAIALQRGLRIPQQWLDEAADLMLVQDVTSTPQPPVQPSRAAPPPAPVQPQAVSVAAPAPAARPVAVQPQPAPQPAATTAPTMTAERRRTLLSGTVGGRDILAEEDRQAQVKASADAFRARTLDDPRRRALLESSPIGQEVLREARRG